VTSLGRSFCITNANEELFEHCEHDNNGHIPRTTGSHWTQAYQQQSMDALRYCF